MSKHCIMVGVTVVNADWIAGGCDHVLEVRCV